LVLVVRLQHLVPHLLVGVVPPLPLVVGVVVQLPHLLLVEAVAELLAQLYTYLFVYNVQSRLIFSYPNSYLLVV
jgi:hypothetical protein